MDDANKTGPEAYPPTPTATSGLKSLIIPRASDKLVISFLGKLKFANKSERFIPAMGKPMIL